MKNNRKVLYGLVALALLLSVVGISIGFAALSQDLVIEGTAEVVPANWEIIFKDLGDAVEVGGGQEDTEPQLTTTTRLDSFNVILTKPGDSVSYTFKVSNEGDIDAKFESMTMNTPVITGTASDPTDKTADETLVASALIYTITYADGTALTAEDALAVGNYRTLKMTIAYDSEATDIPTAPVNITNLGAVLTYVQAD